jgi:putative tricarboxylic transport membrane protein
MRTSVRRHLLRRLDHLDPAQHPRRELGGGDRFGAIPAGGAEIPTFLSYVTEKRLTRHPEEFGNGAIEGVAGPEASNNASAAGSLVTMLALGLLTSATAAVLLAAFQGFGIQTGPLLLEREADLVWALIASLFIGNTLLLILNLPLAPLWAKLLKTPRPYCTPASCSSPRSAPTPSTPR